MTEPERRSGTLLEVLEEARELGLLGPGPVERQRRHASDLARAAESVRGSFLELGSGGGLPGLVLAQEWPEVDAVLLDAQQRRCDFLVRAVEQLGLTERVAVVCGRAEELARTPELRGAFGLVVARSFGSPPVTAECGVGFLRVDGCLLVTEPPKQDGESNRWDTAGLARLGFSSPQRLRSGKTGAVLLTLTHTVDERWPRRNGMPAKRPLW